MKVNSEIREQHKVPYMAAIRREKSKSWKEFCNLTSATNPWNSIYKMVAGKTKHTTHNDTETRRRIVDNNYSRHHSTRYRNLRQRTSKRRTLKHTDRSKRWYTSHQTWKITKNLRS